MTDSDNDPGPQPSRTDKRWYFGLMATCIGLFVLSWAVIDRYSTLAAVIVSAVAVAIPPFAVIVANAVSNPPNTVVIRYPARLCPPYRLLTAHSADEKGRQRWPARQ